MNRKQLKEIIKPLVQECIEESMKEAILTSGILSQVISEVVKGMSPLIVEQETAPSQQPQSRYSEILQKSEKNKLSETKKTLLDSIGKTSYGGVNVFEGIKETIPDETSNGGPANPMQGIAPNDPGVDINQLFDFNKAKILAQGKKRQK